VEIRRYVDHPASRRIPYHPCGGLVNRHSEVLADLAVNRLPECHM
jgi:hypothetical protein